MNKWYTAVLAGALALALAGCNSRENRIHPGEGTVQSSREGGSLTGETEIISGEPGKDTEPGADSGPVYEVGKPGEDYILPDALSHVYTEKELSGLTRDELRLARNEIYARHGRKFKSDDLNQYFSKQPWYQGTIAPDQFDDSVMSRNERDNLKVIQGMEAGMAVCTIPKTGTEEFPRIDGSTATIPISQAMYRMATGASKKEAEAAITHGKTTRAWLNLISNDEWREKPDLVIAYEPGEAVEEARKQSGNDIIMKPIGRDALVFLANKSNPVRSLTSSQLVDIYSGKLTNWKEAGGKNQKIQAFQRPEDSGSQNLMNKLVMKGKEMAEAPMDQVIGEMGELLERVSDYDGSGDALGYSVYYYARNMYQKPELAFMAVDGILPSSETIRDKSYPFVNDFYAAIRADTPKDSKTYELFQWLTGEDGQSLINGLGYVGVSEDARELPKELLEPDEDFTASIPLPEGQVILGDGTYLYGEQGFGVFDSHMKLLQFISHGDSEYVSSFSECSRDEVIPMMDTRTGEYGHYSIGKNRWVDRERDDLDDGYISPESFAADHPGLLKKHGAAKEDVEIRYYGETSGPVVIIESGQGEYYYDPDGTFLLQFDTGGKDEEDLPSRYVYSLGNDMAYITIVDYGNENTPQSWEYQVYKKGRLMKTLRDEEGYIADIQPHFYTRRYGNYLYVYNYQDEPCARFLIGYYMDD